MSPCPPKCEETGFCIRACSAVQPAPACPACQDGDCDNCTQDFFDPITDKPMLCDCPCNTWEER